MKSLEQILTFFKGAGRANTIKSSHLQEAFSNLKPPWGSISLASTAVTDITVAGTYVKAAGLTQENNAGYLTTTSDNRITYVGDSPRHFHIAVSVAMSIGPGAGNTVGLAVALNDTVDLGTETQRYVGNPGDIGSTALHADFLMNNGDYIELWVTNQTNNANDVTIENLYMFMVGMLV